MFKCAACGDEITTAGHACYQAQIHNVYPTHIIRETIESKDDRIVRLLEKISSDLEVIRMHGVKIK